MYFGYAQCSHSLLLLVLSELTNWDWVNEDDEIDEPDVTHTPEALPAAHADVDWTEIERKVCVHLCVCVYDLLCSCSLFRLCVFVRVCACVYAYVCARV